MSSFSENSHIGMLKGIGMKFVIIMFGIAGEGLKRNGKERKEIVVKSSDYVYLLL